MRYLTGLGCLGERLGSGDGERKTLLTRQIAFEPLPASVLFAFVLPMILGGKDCEVGMHGLNLCGTNHAAPTVGRRNPNTAPTTMLATINVTAAMSLGASSGSDSAQTAVGRSIGRTNTSVVNLQSMRRNRDTMVPKRQARLAGSNIE